MKRITLSILIILITASFAYSQSTVGLINHSDGSLDDGYVLFAPLGSLHTYLIDKCGKVQKTWQSSYRPGQSCYILEDGTLLRTGNVNSQTFNVGGKGGVVEKFDWQGNLLWSYSVSDATKCQHHDVKALPNGNILIIAWESKSDSEAIAQGRNPSLVPKTVWSEQILEIQPLGTNDGIIVWEWHLWDHLVQDYDKDKPNFATVKSNPQLINLNYKASATNSDWIHLNSIDYNPSLDQILVSSHEFNEIWIIDHSTTSAEAKGNTGGNSNKGGDILYRWGNPSAYNTAGTTQFFGQHNAYWIEKAYPYENQIMVFNNGLGRTGGNYSTIEIIDPPVDGYNYNPTLPYLPATNSWIYNSGNPFSFYATNISGAQQLPNGNVLYCDGPAGSFTEINSEGTPVWKYVNPVSQSKILQQGSSPSQNLVFRCTYYPFDYSGFAGISFSNGTTIETTNLVSDDCQLATSIDASSDNDNALVFPNPANEYVVINIASKSVALSELEIFNSIGELIILPNIQIGIQEIRLDTKILQDGLYFVAIKSGNDKIVKSFVVLR